MTYCKGRACSTFYNRKHKKAWAAGNKAKSNYYANASYDRDMAMMKRRGSKT